MLRVLLATTIVALASNAALAKSITHHKRHGQSHVEAAYKKHGAAQHHSYRAKQRLTRPERRAIARSAARLAKLKRRIRRDGRVTPRERVKLVIATKQHRALVRRAKRN